MSLASLQIVKEEHAANGNMSRRDSNSGTCVDVLVSERAAYDGGCNHSQPHNVTDNNVMTSTSPITCNRTMTSWELITSLCEILGPIMCSSVLNFGIQTIANSYVGRRLGSTSFAYFTIGISVFNMFALCLGMGLVGALSTLVSQAYGRTKQQGPDIGIFVQRAVLICVLIMIPISLLLTMGGPMFALVFGEELGAGALLFTRHSVPYFFCSTLSRVFIKTLNAINEPSIPLMCSCAAVITCIVLNHFFTHSIESAVYCLTASNTVMLVLLVLFTRFHPRVTFWKECSWPATQELRSISGLKSFLKVGIPSLLSTCSEWWAFEVLYIISASIGVHVIAEFSLFSTISLSMFSVSVAVSVAASVRVGNSLGANQPDLARQYAIISMYMSTFIAIINGITVYIFRRQIAALFTSDEALTSAFMDIAPLLFFDHLTDTTQYTLQGIYRGVDMSHDAAKIVVATLWAVGIPCSIIFGKFMELETKGIVVSMIFGFFVEIPLLWSGFQRWNWTELSKKAVLSSCTSSNIRDCGYGNCEITENDSSNDINGAYHLITVLYETDQEDNSQDDIHTTDIQNSNTDYLAVCYVN
eukprot:Tbor_TRINITY_DN6158_c0_g2::TRINITY_DN6158_c0_g2_i8::g.22038::m.22038/K03327/TC.MATE, SLC47A, norM, mdtK, dinF; multidrug resistance protein, MATE family